MNRSIRRLLVPTVALALGACKELGPEHALPVDSAVYITSHDDLGATNRTLRLRCQTAKIYGCANYSLNTVMGRAASSISIDFRGVTAPNICLTALGPATSDVRLGTLADGDYTLRITAAGETSDSRLSVSGDAIAISPAPSRTVLFPRPVLQRVPPETIWGVVGYASSTLAPKAQEYLDALKAAGATSADLAPGDYEYFTVDRLGRIGMDASGYWYAQPYAFHFSGGVDKLSPIVHGQTDSLSISVYTDRGEQFSSWTAVP